MVSVASFVAPAYMGQVVAVGVSVAAVGYACSSTAIALAGSDLFAIRIRLVLGQGHLQLQEGAHVIETSGFGPLLAGTGEIQMPEGHLFINLLTKAPDSQFAKDPEPRWTQDL